MEIRAIIAVYFIFYSKKYTENSFHKFEFFFRFLRYFHFSQQKKERKNDDESRINNVHCRITNNTITKLQLRITINLEVLFFWSIKFSQMKVQKKKNWKISKNIIETHR